MFAVCAIALLCLAYVSHSEPLTCKDVLQPLDELDPNDLQGEWAMVAGSLRVIESDEPFDIPDSVSLNFYNSTFTKGNLYGESINTTFTHTSCRDCILLSFDVESGKRQHFYLFSRRRQLEQEEIEEFTAQVECLKMPPPAVMDPTKELCPDETASDPAARNEEKTKGQRS
uniref:Apolipoprotein M n=1 Tax=Sparus aurata TaxID=8175 RepID=A0A671U4N2_SPAAU